MSVTCKVRPHGVISYVHNNPLSGVDPSGYGHLSDALDSVSLMRHIFRAVGPDVAGVIHGIGVAACGPMAPACAWVGGWNLADTFGASTSDGLRAGVIGAVSSYAFSSVADGIGGADWASTGGTIQIGSEQFVNAIGFAALVVAQGAVGGVMAELQGGKFGHGFAAAGFSKLASPFLPNTPFSNGRTDFGQIVAAAVIGGTASEISGGKFANGAITGAFVNLFNQQRVLAQKGLTSYTQSEYHKAFDENGRLITREVSSDSWEPLLGGGSLLEKIITSGSKRSLPIDIQLNMRTVSEEVRFDLWQRDVKAEALYIDGSKIPVIEPYHYGPWMNTGTSDWLPSGYKPSTYPVGGRICPISCGEN